MVPKFHIHVDRVPPDKMFIPKGTLAYQQKLWAGGRRSIQLFDTEKRIIGIMSGKARAAAHFTYIARGPAWFEKLDPECRVVVTYGNMEAFPANIIAACEGRVIGVVKKFIRDLGEFELSRNLGLSKKRKLVTQMELADFVSVIHLQRMQKEIDLEFLKGLHPESTAGGVGPF